MCQKMISFLLQALMRAVADKNMSLNAACRYLQVAFDRGLFEFEFGQADINAQTAVFMIAGADFTAVQVDGTRGDGKA